ncbi:hypothetical protein DL93DRAFT_2170709 [Clavulina sp. PMI_390]|nr:hypothetical protein DL93DRAFT_2170709 [Clavulina sp. PMI_390]
MSSSKHYASTPSASTSISDDIEVYGDADLGASSSTSRREANGTSHHGNGDIESHTPLHRRSMSVNGRPRDDQAEEFSKTERTFMMASALMVAGLTATAITVVLTNADL